MNESTEKLSFELDARVWAKDFVLSVKSLPELPLDEERMVRWFGGALRCGHDMALGKLERKVA